MRLLGQGVDGGVVAEVGRVGVDGAGAVLQFVGQCFEALLAAGDGEDVSTCRDEDAG